MTGQLQPLSQQFPIVDPITGQPTLYFIKWAQQRQIDIEDSASADQVQAAIELYLAEHTLTAGTGITITPSGSLNDEPTISAPVQGILNQLSSTRGSVIYRGATDWQTLAPGTSGYVLQTNGAGADPSWVAQSGGGGGKIFGGLTPPNTLVSTSNFATKGVLVSWLQPANITHVGWTFNASAGQTYTAHILEMAGNTVAAVTASSAPITAGATVAGLTQYFNLAAALVAGKTYAFALSLSSAPSGTTSLGLQGATVSASTLIGFAGIPGAAFIVATTAPTIGAVNTSSAISPFNLLLGGTNT